jgi:hypothetical protein
MDLGGSDAGVATEPSCPRIGAVVNCIRERCMRSALLLGSGGWTRTSDATGMNRVL